MPLTKILYPRLLLVCLVCLTPMTLAQVGHPVKGSWSGTLQSDAGESTRIRLFIRARDGELSGVINPGRRSVDIKNIKLDAATWKLSMVADMPKGKLVLDGTISNLGSWTNRKYRGSYTLGSESGKFEIILN